MRRKYGDRLLLHRFPTEADFQTARQGQLELARRLPAEEQQREIQRINTLYDVDLERLRGLWPKGA